MADRIITPCNVARSWHWFCQVTAPWNVACGSGMTCRWIRQWQHPAMWHVAMGSWHWIRQVVATCIVASGCGMTCHGIRPNVRHIGIQHLISILTISPQSTCHSAPVCEILSKSDQKNNVMSIFKMADFSHLGFYGPVMGSLNSPCTHVRLTIGRQ